MNGFLWVFEAPKLPPRDAEETNRQADLTRKMFRVVEYLKSVGADKPVTLEKIEGALGIRIREDAKLDEELRRNVRIKYFQGLSPTRSASLAPVFWIFAVDLTFGG